MNYDDNWLQQQDIEQQEQEALQALMDIASAGFRKQADKLAEVSGLSKIWTQQIKPRRENAPH